MSDKFTITKLIEHAERAYKEYGDIQIAIRMDEVHISPVCQVGIAGVGSIDRTVDNTFLCFAANPSYKEISEDPQE
jgi:hypothetical protein